MKTKGRREFIKDASLTAVGASIFPSCLSLSATSAELRHYWVYVQRNLLVDENVQWLIGIMERASKAGYNGVILADFKFNILNKVPNRYFGNVKAAKEAAGRLGMEIIPAIFSIGYSEGLLAHNPNLAEGLPVKEAPFLVEGREIQLQTYPPILVKSGEARLLPDPSVHLRNGDFEEADGDKFSGWDWQENVGKTVFADRTVVSRGLASLRMENPRVANPETGNCRVYQTIKVTPYRYYHITGMIKSGEWISPEGMTRIYVAGKDKLQLQWRHLGLKRTQDWTEHHVVFNSLDSDEVMVYLGVWGGDGGKLWWDGVRLEEIGPVNLLRRPGTPVAVKGEDGTLYEEGRDFEPLKDEKAGMIPYIGNFDVYHEPPAIKLTEKSRLKDGQLLRVSFYHPIAIYDGQMACCMSEPELYEILEDQTRRVIELFKPKRLFMSHDEIRVANWCKACQDRKITPGEILADNVRRCRDIVRRLDPEIEVGIWSDMFDPHHNAHDNYYIVNGTWEGSWDGLSKDMVIGNWNWDKKVESLRFFAERGHRQIITGYYDSDPARIKEWLEAGRGLKGIIGVVYTTWQNNYNDLEPFIKYARI